jgi:hypothetical protein
MAKKNFTITTVATAPSPATSGTSLIVASGDGALFAVNEPAIVFPVNDQPLVANAEIVMVTDVTTDTLTITRGQESTTARTIVIGDIIIQGITAKDWNDLLALVAGKITAFADPNADRIVFWDDSVGAFAALTASTGLTLSGTNLTVRSASTTQTGIVERATDTEFTNGTDTTRFINAKQAASIAQTMTNKTLTSPVINTGVSGTAVLDEDTMASNSNTKLATQQSIKAYVDSGTTTLTNKTIDGDNNTLQNISNASITGALDGWIPITDFGNYTFTLGTADDPSFPIEWDDDMSLLSYLSVGMKIKWTQNGTVRYGFITYADANGGLTNTEMVIYGGTDYNVDNTTTYPVSNICISREKSPYGFPMSPAKWSVVETPTTFSQASATSTTWYNATSITIPIGVWSFVYRANVQTLRTGGGGNTNLSMGLVISETSASGTPLSLMTHSQNCRIPFPTDLEFYNWSGSFSGQEVVSLSSKDILYMNVMSVHQAVNDLSCFNMSLRATCAYL